MCLHCVCHILLLLWLVKPLSLYVLFGHLLLSNIWQQKTVKHVVQQKESQRKRHLNLGLVQ